MNEEWRGKIARVICCFAEESVSCSECEYNTPADLFPDCFPDIREETDQIIAIFEEHYKAQEEHLSELIDDVIRLEEERMRGRG